MEPTQVSEFIRRLTMGALMVIHIQLAAFFIGMVGIGVTMEFFGLLSRGHPHFERMARALARTAVLMYSTGAVIAIIFVLVISLFWPTFWYIIMRVTFWPMVLEGVTFVLTVLYLFPWYFAWERLGRFKWAHLSLGLASVAVLQLQQSMIDVMAGYMLTPTPSQDLLRVFFNPSAIPLDMHRIVGDVSFAGFVIAGYAAIRTLRNRDAERLQYYDWMGSIGLLAGLGFLFIQPAIGIAYLEEIRASSPGAFSTMMRGRLSAYFLLQVVFLSGLFFLSVLYMALQVRKSRSSGSRLLWGLLLLVGLSALLLMQPYVIGLSLDRFVVNWINPIGSMQPWKYIAMAGLTLGSIVALLSYLGTHYRALHWGRMEQGGRGAQIALLTLAVLASFMMVLMGYIRESSRQPYLIYYQRAIDAPEQFPTLPPTPTPEVPSSFAPGNSDLSNAFLESRRGAP